MKTLFMETTTIDAAKTAAEITSLLVQAGAHQLMMEYDDNKEISGLRFALKMKDRSFVCVLPARVDPIFRLSTVVGNLHTTAHRKPLTIGFRRAVLHGVNCFDGYRPNWQ